MQPTPPPVAGQEFPFGWRYVQRGDDLVEVPLTLEDALHPKEGDVFPGSIIHDADCTYLATVFRSRPLSPAFAFVSHDLLVDWGVSGIRNHSPDVAVFAGLNREPNPSTGLLDLPAYGGRCELIVEVVSPSTRVNDVVHKFDHYYRVGVPLYVIIDQEREDGPHVLRAYRRTPTQYVEIAPDAEGRVPLPVVGLLLGLRDDRAVCFDATTGEEIEDFSRQVRQRAQERAQFERYKEEAEQAHTEQAEEWQRVRSEIDRARQKASFAEQKAALAEQEISIARQRAALAEQEISIVRQKAALAEQQTALAAREAEEEGRKREKADELVRELRETLRRLQGGGAADAD